VTPLCRTKLSINTLALVTFWSKVKALAKAGFRTGVQVASGELVTMRFALIAVGFGSASLVSGAVASPLVSTGTVTSTLYNPNNASNAYFNASSIVPGSGDVAVSSSIFSTNYTPTHEATVDQNGQPYVGTAGVLVDGQTAVSPSNAGNASANLSQPTYGTNAAFDLNGTGWYAEFQLPATSSGLGYDITSTEVITGHQDGRTDQAYDLLVSSDGVTFYSLSNGTSPALGTGGSGFTYSPNNGGAAESTVTPASGTVLATGVKYFEFVDQSGGSDVYREVALYGTADLPEPGTACLVGVAGIGLLIRRRRRVA
jgi:hypothetical protein